MTNSRHASLSSAAPLAASLPSARFGWLSLFAAFGAVSLTTAQALMLTTRVYACEALATFASAALYAILLAPVFYLALIGLAAAPDARAGRASGRSKAVVLGLGYLMAFIAVIDFDASFDRSSPVETSFVVAAHRTHEGDGDRAFINIYDRLRPTTWLAARTQGPTPLPFTLNDADEALVEPGRSRVAVPMHAGFLGVPWFPAAEYRLENGNAI